MTSIIRLSTSKTIIRISTSTSISTTIKKICRTISITYTVQAGPLPPLKLKGFTGISPAPSAPHFSPNDYFLLRPSAQPVSSAPRRLTPTALLFTPSYNLYGSQTQTLTREKEKKMQYKKELDDKIYELPDDPPKHELGDGLTNILEPEAEDVLDEGFLNKKELEDELDENIKEEYGFKEIKDAFDEASVPLQLEFLYGGMNENVIQACYFLSPNNNNRVYCFPCICRRTKRNDK